MRSRRTYGGFNMISCSEKSLLNKLWKPKLCVPYVAARRTAYRNKNWDLTRIKIVIQFICDVRLIAFSLRSLAHMFIIISPWITFSDASHNPGRGE